MKQHMTSIISKYFGQFRTFYLSLKGYHRYHIPVNLNILKAAHIPGKL